VHTTHAATTSIEKPAQGTSTNTVSVAIGLASDNAVSFFNVAKG